MKRTQIYLTAEQADVLDRMAQASGRTRSDLIREAIEKQFVNPADTEALVQALMASAGAWKDRQEDGASYVERLRTGRLARLYPDE